MTANAKWASTSIEEKLEILRRDIIRIQEAQNNLADQFRKVTRPLSETIARFEAALEQIRQSQGFERSNPSDSRQADSSGVHDAAAGRPSRSGLP